MWREEEARDVILEPPRLARSVSSPVSFPSDPTMCPFSDGYSTEDEEEDESIHWRVDLNGIPFASAQLPPPPALSIRPLPHQEGVKRYQTKVLEKWEDAPRDLRNKLLPHMKQNKRGYSGVSPQPGLGSGFQVQAWSALHRKTMRLATCKDEKVGALIVAASSIDPTLTNEALGGRAWFVRVVADEGFRQSWILGH